MTPITRAVLSVFTVPTDVDANRAYSRKQALAHAETLAQAAVTC